MKKFSKKILTHQLALAGLLSIGTVVFQSYAYATDYGTLTGNSITLSNGDVVTANTTHTDGFWTGISDNANIPATINLGTGSKVISNQAGAPVRGITIKGNGTTLNANNLTIEAKGGYTSALYVTGYGAQVDLGSGGSITVEGSNTPSAIMVTNKASVKANGIAIDVKGSGTSSNYFVVQAQQRGAEIDLGTGSSIKTDGWGASAVSVSGLNGIVADGPAKFTANELTITTLKDNSKGLETQANSIANLGSNTTITTNGNNSTGLWILGTLNADALNVTTKGGGDSNALEVRLGGIATVGAGSNIRSEQNMALVASETGSVINFNGTATKRNTLYSGGSAGASAQFDGATVNLKNTDVTIDRNGSLGLGLWALGGGIINAENTKIDVAQGSRGVYAMTEGQINLTGDTVIKLADNTGMAIATQYNAGYDTSKITGSGKMTIDGGILARGNALIDLNMSAGSRLTGATSVDLANGGKLNMNLTGTQWNMIQDSAVTKLGLNNSVVTFANPTVGETLTVGDLSGSGTFVMKVDMAGDGITNSGDKLIVTGVSSGNHHIREQNSGARATTGNETYTIVETADGMATFDMATKLERGGYLYDVRRTQADSKNWELYSGGKITPAADTSANFLNAGYLLNYAETQSLLQRMGELRQAENSQGDAWVRAYTGKLDSFDSGKLSGFDMDYSGIQAGADKRLDVNGGHLYLGAMVGASQADPNYVSGDGDLKSYNLGVYGTYVTDSDFYVDGVLKYNHLKNKFSNVVDTQKNLINGDAKSAGYGISLEVGKRFYFTSAKSGYYIEPQAQLTYTHQGSASTTASNGLVTDMDAYDSTIGRISALAGYEVKSGANPMNVYVKTGYVTEMSGDVNYALNGHKENNDFGGSWWENGVGITAQIKKQHNFYLEGSYSTGSKFDQMQLNAGYRYNF